MCQIPVYGDIIREWFCEEFGDTLILVTILVLNMVQN